MSTSEYLMAAAALTLVGLLVLFLTRRGREPAALVAEPSAGRPGEGPAAADRAARAAPKPAQGAKAPPAQPPPAPEVRPATDDEDFDELDEDDITLVTVKFDLAQFRAAIAPEGAPTPLADDDDYLSMSIEEIDEDLEPAARAHRFVADTGAETDDPTLTTNAFLVSAARQTDRGQRRKKNEDRYLALDREGVFFVADGMGGYAGGEIASQLAVDTIGRAFQEQSFDALVHAELPRRAQELAQAMQMANLEIWERATDDDALRGMGTTLVGALFALRKKRVYIGHIGDSRCYRLRDGKLKQLTVDHTLASYGVSGPTAHRLIRAVGIATEVEIDIIMAKPKIGDVYLFCSDGLNKMMPDEDIARLLGGEKDLARAAQGLVDTANERGGRDNVTVVLVGIEPPPR